MISRRALNSAALSAAAVLPAIASILNSTGAAAQQAPASGSTTSSASDWRETYAYTLGLQAYIFGFPWIYLPALRWNWVTVPKPAGSITPYAPLNHFYNVRKLATAEYRDGGSPNNDTLYSIAWVDLSKEPVVLSHPDMGDRYFTFELACLDSDNFAYVGKRTTGGAAGTFAIVGPGWEGSLPPGLKPLPRSRTNSVLIFGRTLIDGPADQATVNALQDQYRLIPLSLWGQVGATLPESRDVWPPYDPKADPLGEWKTMNRAMSEDPVESRLAKLAEQFANIGIGPGRDVDALDDPTKRGLIRASVDGRKLLNDVIKSGVLGKRVNGWNIPPAALGRAGLSDDFLLRASLQCLAGIIANDPAEAVYFNTAMDASGEPLDGSKRYTLRFAPGTLPKVNAFWSMTLYDPTYNLTPNPINRYSIGNRTAGLKPDPDGGLTIYIQAASPGKERASNWLPSTQKGGFLLILRAYMPGEEIVQQAWAPPGVAVAG
ncbi:MAG: DUF1254 domain-containing protein [Hyphomicrobiales bacterium]